MYYSGAKNGVSKRLRELPGLDHMLDVGGCTLHTLSNANRIATKAIFPEIPDLAEDVFAFFDRSHKRQHEFKQVLTY